VTGGGRGLGRAIALALAAEGLAVAVAARSLDQLESTAREVRGRGGSALDVPLDVTDPASIATALATVAARLGPVDVLVNNAGIAESAPFSKTTPEMWARHLDINATGPYRLTRAVLSGMLERGWGRVVNIASMAGLHGAPYVAAYTASKHALVGLIHELAYELAPAVRVNGVAPGPIETDLRGPAALGMADRSIGSIDLSTNAAPNVPLGKVPATADYAGGYVFLASRRDARPATGAVLNLDSGIGVRGIGRTAGGARLAAKYAPDQG